MFTRLKEFFPYFVHYRTVAPTIIALFVATGLQSLSVLLLPMVNKIIYDDLIATRDPRFLAFVLVYILTFVLLANFSTFLVDSCSGHLRTKLAGLIRHSTFYRMLSYRMMFFQERETGSLVQNLVADIDTVSQVLTQFFQIFAYLMQLGILLLVVAALEPDIAAVYALVLAVYMGWVSLWRKPVESSSKRIGEEYGTLNAFFVEAIPGVKEIKLHGLQGYILSRLSRNMQALKLQQMRNALFNSFRWAAAITVPWFAFGSILYVGLGKFEDGSMTLGSLITMFVLMWGMFTPVEKISTIFNTLNNALPAARRVNALKGGFEESSGDSHPEFLDSLEFQKVVFSYDGLRKSLDGVDLRIARGSRISIVGRSGSGKSTLLNLLLRFQEGYQGRILLDGKDLNSVDPDQLRALFCVVVQDPYLFNDSIRGNIDFSGRLSHSELMEICDLVHLGAFIRSLPDGLDTRVGERAAKVSGGEKQRIALARALARKAEILVLDEATSALDPVTERQFRETVRTLWESRGLTVISVTHRAAAARDADYVYVLEGGKVAEHGSPVELLKRRGAFHRMFAEGDGSTEMAPPKITDALAAL